MKRILIILVLISSLILTSCKGNIPKDNVDENNGENTNIESPEKDNEEYTPYGG